MTPAERAAALAWLAVGRVARRGVPEPPAAFVERSVGGAVFSGEGGAARAPAERGAALAWLGGGRVAVDGWPGGIESNGRQTADLALGLRAMRANDLAS